jgi:hypothetical protein
MGIIAALDSGGDCSGGCRGRPFDWRCADPLEQGEERLSKSEDGARRPEDEGGAMSYFSKDEWNAESAVREQNVIAQEERDETILDCRVYE